MSDTPFAELYCRHNRLPIERYEKTLLKRALYPHARWIYHVLRLVRPDHYAADLDLVRNVGSLYRFREFSNDVQQFLHHPANRGMLRRTFNVRISTKQLRRIVRDVMHPEDGKDPKALKADEDQTAAPFAKPRRDDDAPASVNAAAEAVNRQ